MDKRYQVFVSSTFRDLEEERQEVMHALLELDCIPSGMELFPAANESQWNLIRKVIEDSDYYLLIIGGRYGSCASEGISYTEKEYRYACEIGKPVISFLHRNPGKIIADRTESTEEGKAKLAAFRALAEAKLCKHWETSQELGSVVSRSLVQLIKSTPAIGWVRANEIADRDATQELLKLRRTVDELQAKLQSANAGPSKGSEDLAQGEDLQELNVTYYWRRYDEDDDDSRNVNDVKCIVSWNSCFAAIAPLMIHAVSEKQIRERLAWFALRSCDKYYGAEEVVIDETDFQTVKIQLRAVGLIKIEMTGVPTVDPCWTLTPYGDELMTLLRAIRKKKESATQ